MGEIIQNIFIVILQQNFCKLFYQADRIVVKYILQKLYFRKYILHVLITQKHMPINTTCMYKTSLPVRLIKHI